MRTIVRTLLAAAAGAVLVASGTTAVLWSDPALAGGEPAVVDREVPQRAGLVPSASAPTPTPAPVPEPAVPEPAVPVEPGPAPAAGRVAEPDDEPVRRAAPQAVERRAAAPEVVEPRVEAPPVRSEPAPRDVEPDADQEQPASPRRQEDSDGRDDSDERDERDERVDDRREAGEDDDSLLGGLTEPLGVSCGGLLSTVCG